MIFKIMNLFVECAIQCRTFAGFRLMMFLIVYTPVYTGFCGARPFGRFLALPQSCRLTSYCMIDLSHNKELASHENDQP